MAVPAYKRNESKIEFIDNFTKLRKSIIEILMRDFGIKARAYSVDLIGDIYNITEEDRATLKRLSDTYGMSPIDVNKYPEWLINEWRAEILMIMNNIGISIACANTIYVTNIQEFYTRRMHWDNAIGYCMALQDKLHEVIDCVNGIKLGSYEIVFEYLTKEVKLLKAVRKSDNRLVSKVPPMYQPYFYAAGYCYNNYPVYPFAPSYTANTNSLGVVGGLREMCRIAA